MESSVSDSKGGGTVLNITFQRSHIVVSVLYDFIGSQQNMNLIFPLGLFDEL